MTSRPALNKNDLILLNILQEEFPLVDDPWESIGRKTSMSGGEVLARIRKMADTGILRGITPVFESGKRKGVVSTLVALRVPEEEISGIADIINGYPEVSHNYRRDHEYNLWFTLSSDSPIRIDEIIREILSQAGISPDAMLNLKTVGRFKIDVRFPFVRDEGEGE
jgi:DNA-binding Lrp family transcriptional regulator